MRRHLILCFCILLIPSWVLSQTNIRLKGSNSLLPLSMKLAAEFMKKNPGQPIAVSGGGSGIGIASMTNRNCEIGMSSRSMNDFEKNSLKEYSLMFQESIVAWDGIVMVVNKDNPVEKFTREQLAGIYSGTIKNWKELGGNDAEIIIYSRLSNSGTYQVFSEKVLDGKEITKNALPVISNSAVVQYVRENKNAIGFACFAYVDNRVKTTSISWDAGTTFLKPTYDNIRDKTYPLSRPLYFYFLEQNSDLVQPFLTFLKSAEGKNLTKNEGYILAD
ncbi:MAG: phosphate ABC transporter substrate-binding protein [Bacteroidota bacterium]